MKYHNPLTVEIFTFFLPKEDTLLCFFATRYDLVAQPVGVAAFERNGASLLEDRRQQPFPILMKVILLITMMAHRLRNEVDLGAPGLLDHGRSPHARGFPA
jgi:hypothetical protein